MTFTNFYTCLHDRTGRLENKYIKNGHRLLLHDRTGRLEKPYCVYSHTIVLHDRTGRLEIYINCIVMQ